MGLAGAGPLTAADPQLFQKSGCSDSQLAAARDYWQYTTRPSYRQGRFQLPYVLLHTTPAWLDFRTSANASHRASHAFFNPSTPPLLWWARRCYSYCQAIALIQPSGMRLACVHIRSHNTSVCLCIMYMPEQVEPV